jgi:hypothetical protein
MKIFLFVVQAEERERFETLDKAHLRNSMAIIIESIF